MARLQKIVVMSLGGSIIIPDEIQTEFLKKFRQMILKFIKKDYRFVIVTGGGKLSRNYQNAAAKISEVKNEDKDFLGIAATRLNANLIRAIFGSKAYPLIIENPEKSLPDQNKYNLFIASGWKPGSSTDFVAVLLAQKFSTKEVINISNVDYVYDKDPSKFKDAKPFEKISWSDYLKIVGKQWRPGLNSPFDPIASQLARKYQMSVIFAGGNNLNNLENILTNKKFQGTIIS
jgi:uridylate kinase